MKCLLSIRLRPDRLRSTRLVIRWSDGLRNLTFRRSRTGMVCGEEVALELASRLRNGNAPITKEKRQVAPLEAKCTPLMHTEC